MRAVVGPRGADLDDNLDLGRQTAEEISQLREERRWTLEPHLSPHGTPTDSGVDTCLHQLASSPAGVVIVNLEDQWLEARPHNVPGTSTERPNWRRRMSRTLDEIVADPTLGQRLGEVNRARESSARAED